MTNPVTTIQLTSKPLKLAAVICDLVIVVSLIACFADFSDIGTWICILISGIVARWIVRSMIWWNHG